ncbi:hypothetical protein CTAYLR_001441 [Chrysophaeum taylorii]|uniref:PDZ domain-containing protein n=1 Tax=Chrysophaeum taylorii TaxID=2483200 RepID=A0AAD7XJF5_9STRA|nr:hypothetical protein CTAYLR_001441 [Chrysophaeum taylorii]
MLLLLLLIRLVAALDVSAKGPPRTALLKQLRRQALVVGILATATTACAAAPLSAEQRFAAEAWRETDRLFYERTFNGLDWFGERQKLVGRSYKSADEARAAVAELLSRLGDPYTRYVAPDAYERLAAATVGDAAFVAGAGVQLVDLDGPTIVDVEPGAPADAAGLRPGDVVDAVGGDSVATAADAARRLRGAEGSRVEVTARRGQSTVRASISRAIVALSSVRFTSDGALRIRSFSLETPDLVAKKLPGSGALLVDLRGNGGGSLEGGIETARLFLKSGEKIVAVLDKRGAPFEYAAIEDGPAVSFRGKTTILVDKQTASAAEVFAAALAQNGVATLVGAQTDHTYGKGVIQVAQPLGSPPGAGGAAAVTVAKYTTPDGSDINGNGIPTTRTVDRCTLADAPRQCLSS